MSKRKSIILLIFLFAVIIIVIPRNTIASEELYVNEKTNYKVVIEDDANLLTDEEEMSLISRMKPLTEYGNIAFKSISVNSLRSTDKFAESYYKKTFGTQSGTIFLIDMLYRKIYIYSYGQNYKRVTTAKANVITDNIYKMASNKDYYGCAKEAYSEILTVLEGGRIAEPMKYICNALISLIVSQFIIFFVIVKILKSKKAKNSELVSNAGNSYFNSPPVAKLIYQNRVYSPVNTDSGGRWWRPVVVEAGGRRRSAAVATVSKFFKWDDSWIRVKKRSPKFKKESFYFNGRLFIL